MGEMITFAANGGTCPGYLARASKEEAPGVVVIQEWWGLNGHIKSIVDRFAAAGYTALAPDLFHGATTKEPDEAQKMMMAMNIDEVAKDLHGATAHLHRMTNKKVGVIGFCMGGALSLFAACENPADVAACVDFYGSHSAIAYNFNALGAPVLGIFGGQDTFTTPDVVTGLDEGLTNAGVEHSFITYPDADHAFFNDDRPEVYRPADADDAWQKTLAFYGQRLR